MLSATKNGEGIPFEGATLTVGLLEKRLLSRFPAADAEEWDRTGMLVGDADLPVTGICVALDPTVDNIRTTASCGANVLLTHHPLFLDPPASFAPAARGGNAVGARVWEAVSCGVAVISFHTALDVSTEAAQVLPGMLGLHLEGILEPRFADPVRGYGQICMPDDSNLTLDGLAQRCSTAFGTLPRVWGDADRVLGSIVTCTGAAGDDLERACDAGLDALVAGEVRYHKTLDAVSRGLCVIEVGHDVSEFPLTSVLVSSVEQMNVDPSRIRIIGPSATWRSNGAWLR